MLDSGYEPTTSLVAYAGDPQNILVFSGLDSSRSSNNDWSAINKVQGNGNVYIKLEENAQASDRGAEITLDPLDSTNHVLHLWLRNPTEQNTATTLKGRSQMEMGENTDLHEALISERVLLPADLGSLKNFSYQSGDWFTLMELWADPDLPSSEPYPFRITLYLVTSSDGANLVFGVRGEKIDRGENNDDWQTVWEYRCDSYALPIGSWFYLQAYYCQGDASTGRFQLKAGSLASTAATVCDITNYTRHPSNQNALGLRWINPAKIYCNDRVISFIESEGGLPQAYFDDILISKNTNP